jgi:predicted nucleic acid-binding protein
VVVKWFVAEELHDDARELLAGAGPLLAPDILLTEVANALRVKATRGEIDDAAARRAVAAVVGRGEPQLRRSPTLVPRAFELARELDHPVCDCVYLALAEELDEVLVTADRRFVAACADRTRGRVRLLGS